MFLTMEQAPWLLQFTGHSTTSACLSRDSSCLTPIAGEFRMGGGGPYGTDVISLLEGCFEPGHERVQVKLPQHFGFPTVFAAFNAFLSLFSMTALRAPNRWLMSMIVAKNTKGATRSRSISSYAFTFSIPFLRPGNRKTSLPAAHPSRLHRLFMPCGRFGGQLVRGF
jgi:hypothetical protein